MFCDQCGSNNPTHARFCQECGHVMHLDETILDKKNLYEAALGEKNRIYYLTKFERFDQQGLGLKASWNWPAFFISGPWALYRKMYGWGFACLGITFFSSVLEKLGYPMFSAISFIVLWILFTIYSNSLYHSSIKKKIAIAQLTVKDEAKLLEYLRNKGGIHRWVTVLGGLFIGIFVIAIIAAII